MICVPLIRSGRAARGRFLLVRRCVLPLAFLARLTGPAARCKRGGAPPLIGANGFGRLPGPSLLTCLPAARGLAGDRGEGRSSLSRLGDGQELRRGRGIIGRGNIAFLLDLDVADQLLQGGGRMNVTTSRKTAY